MNKALGIYCLIVLLLGVRIEAEPKDLRLTPVFALTSYSGVRTFVTPQAMCVDDEHGDVYVADTGNGRIAVFNLEGRLLASFKHRASRDQAAEPVGVAVDKSGHVYVSDSSSHFISVYDLRGRPTGKLRPGPEDADTLFGRMTLDTRGNLYVVARNKGRILVYGSDRTLQRKLGGSTDSDRLEMASDVAVDARGRVYALSSQGTAVQVFDSTGAPAFQFGKHGSGRDNVSFPTSIEIDPQGRILITDSFAQRIKVYSESGTYLTDIGGFSFPIDMALASTQSRLFVLEKSAQRLSGYQVQ